MQTIIHWLINYQFSRGGIASLWKEECGQKESLVVFHNLVLLGWSRALNRKAALLFDASATDKGAKKTDESISDAQSVFGVANRHRNTLSALSFSKSSFKKIHGSISSEDKESCCTFSTCIFNRHCYIFKGQLPQERQMKPITVSQLTKCLTDRLTWYLDGGSTDFFFSFSFCESLTCWRMLPLGLRSLLHWLSFHRNSKEVGNRILLQTLRSPASKNLGFLFPACIYSFFFNSVQKD